MGPRLSWALRVLIPRPPPCKGCALPTELNARAASRYKKAPPTALFASIPTGSSTPEPRQGTRRRRLRRSSPPSRLGAQRPSRVKVQEGAAYGALRLHPDWELNARAASRYKKAPPTALFASIPTGSSTPEPRQDTRRRRLRRSSPPSRLGAQRPSRVKIQEGAAYGALRLHPDWELNARAASRYKKAPPTALFASIPTGSS